MPEIHQPARLAPGRLRRNPQPPTRVAAVCRIAKPFQPSLTCAAFAASASTARPSSRYRGKLFATNAYVLIINNGFVFAPHWRRKRSPYWGLFVLCRTAMARSFDTKLQNTRRTLLRVTLGTLGAVSFLGMSARSAKAAKVSKSVVGYQNSPKGSERCDNCRNFEPPDACAKVEGPIDPKGWCSFWVAKS